MRILQIHNFYQQAGGEDIVLANEEKLLCRQGHQVWQYQLHNQSIPQMSKFEVAVDSLWNHTAYQAVRRKIQKHGIHLVHAHNTFPLASPAIYYAAHAEKVPVVQTLHNYRLLCPAATFFRDGKPCEDCLGKSFPWPGILHRCYRHSMPATSMTALMLATHRAAKTYQGVDAYIAPSRFSLEKFVQGGLPRPRLHFKPNFVLDDPGIGSGGGGYALFVGRLAREKGLHHLLSAWSQLKLPFKLRVAGEGPLRPDVEALAQTNPSIEFLGHCPRTRINDLLRNAALLIFPSEWYECSPLSLIEAMAAGTPVLASDHGSLSEMIVPEENGMLYPFATDHALAVSLQEALSRPEHLRQMRYSTRQYYEAHFSPAANYDLLLSIYDTLLPSKIG